MLDLRRIITMLLWPMVFLLPLWITFGRWYLGSGGWLLLFYFLYIAHALFVALIVINVVIHFHAAFKREHLVTAPQAVVLVLLYSCVFLHGIFVVDGGDTEKSVNSLAMLIFGSSFMDTSHMLGSAFFNMSIVLLLTAFVVALGGRFTWVRSLKVWTVIGVILLLAGGTVVGLQIRHDNDPKVKDRKISYDFKLMKQDIFRLTRENGGVLPSGSAKQIAEMSVYNKEHHITKRAGAYVYIPLQEEKKFKLCATFQTDTMDEYFATEDGSTHEGFHRAGYQCITYPFNFTPRLPNR